MVKRRQKIDAPTVAASQPERDDANAAVVPINKARRSRDYSQRALDVVHEATAGHDDDEGDEDE